MTRLELRVAWRYMRSRQGSKLLSLITTIAVSGVIVGVGALVLIIGVMNGLQNDLREKILTGSPDIRVLPWGPDLVMHDWRSTLEKVKQVEGVVSVAPFVSTKAAANAPGRVFRDFANVVGLPNDSGPIPVTSIRSKAVAGKFQFQTLGGYDGVVIGSKLAEKLSVTPGIDSVQFVAVNPNKLDPMTAQPMPVIRSFLVTGIFDTGMFEYDDTYAFIEMHAAQELAGLDSAVTGLEVRTPTRDDAARIALRIQDTIGVGLRTQDWAEQNASLFSALRLEKLGMTVILLLIIMVAAFNIVGTLTMVVTDKTREIGILRAMGMKATSIRRIFFAQGMVIGTLGTAIGLVLGLVISYLVERYHLIPLPPDVYYLDHLPVDTEWLDVIMIVIASLLVAAAATYRPARQAASLYPVDAIRHE